MRLETSFKNESYNARRCTELLSQTPELRDDVYVPRVYGAAEGCEESDRIMIMEWVDGCRYVYSPADFDTADTDRLNDRKSKEKMGLQTREAMDLAISVMSAMTFSWGFVHCDPHPGNILVRQHPTKKGKPQIVRLIRPRRC